MERIRYLLLALLALVPAVTAGSTPAHAGKQLDHVRVQLKWVTQAQFAGYYAAQALGLYNAAGLDVDLLPGSADTAPEPVVAAGGAEFGVDWFSSLLVSREQGMNLVNVAQIFQRSGTTQLTWKPSGITSFDQLRGKTVSVWCCGNQYELEAALVKAGMNPHDPSQITILDQPFDMGLLLNHQVDAAAAETYNELAQVLETVNPATGQLYTTDDLNVLSMEADGVGMLQDGVFVDGDWIAEPAHQEIAVRFLRATEQGWIYCRDHEDACVDIVLANAPVLGAGHQRWMLNEVNALVWPSPAGIGIMDPIAAERTSELAPPFGVEGSRRLAGAYRTDLAEQALLDLPGDTQGLSWQKSPVAVTPGGE